MITNVGVGQNETTRFSPCFHLPGFHLGYLFWPFLDFFLPGALNKFNQGWKDSHLRACRVSPKSDPPCESQERWAATTPRLQRSRRLSRSRFAGRLQTDCDAHVMDTCWSGIGIVSLQSKAASFDLNTLSACRRGTYDWVGARYFNSNFTQKHQQLMRSSRNSSFWGRPF